MKRLLQKIPLAEPILAAVFTAIIATIISLVYLVVYGSITRFTDLEVINVNTIIFGTFLILLVAGVLYFLMRNYIANGAVIFKLLFIVGAAFAVFLLFKTTAATGYKYLLGGIEIIIGIAAAFAVPYFFRHKNIFM